MEYICNAFSLQMIDWSNKDEVVIRIKKVEKPSFEGMVSAVGHADTARVLGVEPNRINVKMSENDIITVAQVMGGRLPEGATELPDGVTMDFFKVQEVQQ